MCAWKGSSEFQGKANLRWIRLPKLLVLVNAMLTTLQKPRMLHEIPSNHCLSSWMLDHFRSNLVWAKAHTPVHPNHLRHRSQVPKKSSFFNKLYYLSASHDSSLRCRNWRRVSKTGIQNTADCEYSNSHSKISKKDRPVMKSQFRRSHISTYLRIHHHYAKLSGGSSSWQKRAESRRPAT